MAKGRWDDFRYFLSVAKTESIKRAAIELQTTQSAVSKRLDRLEHALGVRLLERGPSGTRLTYQGQRILRHALSAETALAQAQEGAERAQERIKGDCSIQLSDGVANYWMASFLPGFFGRYPEIELRMMLDLDQSVERANPCDIRLQYLPPSDTTQISKPLCTIHFMPFASRAYIARHGAPHSVDELASHRLIDQTQHLVSKGSWTTWFSNAPLKHTSLFTNRSGLLGSAVQAGVGIALMPTYLTTFDSSLVPLDIGMRLPLRLYANYHREQALKHPVRSTLGFLTEHAFDVKNMPWFADEFVAPAPDWVGLRQRALDRADVDPDRMAAQ